MTWHIIGHSISPTISFTLPSIIHHFLLSSSPKRKAEQVQRKTTPWAIKMIICMVRIFLTYMYIISQSTKANLYQFFFQDEEEPAFGFDNYSPSSDPGTREFHESSSNPQTVLVDKYQSSRRMLWASFPFPYICTIKCTSSQDLFCPGPSPLVIFAWKSTLPRGGW
jgi:hypothetical protein